MPKKKLLQVFFAILLAIFSGYFAGTDLGLFGIPFYEIFSLIGNLFLNSLSLVVIPLVASSMIAGTARMGSDQSFGRLGLKTFFTFLGTTGTAILIGWLLVILIQPGTGQNISAIRQDKVAELTAAANQGTFAKVEEILLLLIPANILAVAAQGKILGLIFFSLTFGYFLSKIPLESSSILLSFWQGVFQVMMKMTDLVMKAMPIGVFGLVAKVIATTGLESILSVSYFFVTVLLGLLLFMFVALSILLMFLAKVKPYAHFQAMTPALITAFTTSSTAATLPFTLECVEKNSGVSNRIAAFALPLGSSLNLAGSSLQVIIAVMFIAQVYGVPLSLSSQFLIFIMTWLLSFGVAGIPSASLFSIVIILNALGFPAEGVGLIMAVERILDMFRTTVNVYTTSCSTVIIARSEGERLKIARAI